MTVERKAFIVMPQKFGWKKAYRTFFMDEKYMISVLLQSFFFKNLSKISLKITIEVNAGIQ